MTVEIKRVFETEKKDYYQVSDEEIIQYLINSGHKKEEVKDMLSVMQNISINEYKNAAVNIALNKNRYGEQAMCTTIEHTDTLISRKGKVVESE